MLPLAAIRIHTRAGLCQLNDGLAHGCAAAFCIASRRGGDVDALQDAYRSFLAASHGGLDRLGDMIRLREDGREALFYLRNTSAEAVKCSSRCLTASRIASPHIAKGSGEASYRSDARNRHHDSLHSCA